MSTLTDEALDMWHTRAFTAPSFKALAVPPSHMLSLVEEVRELRRLREALTTLEEHMRPAVEHTLTAWVVGPSVRAGVTLARGGSVEVYDGTLADALIALAREVQ